MKWSSPLFCDRLSKENIKALVKFRIVRNDVFFTWVHQLFSREWNYSINNIVVDWNFVIVLILLFPQALLKLPRWTWLKRHVLKLDAELWRKQLFRGGNFCFWKLCYPFLWVRTLVRHRKQFWRQNLLLKCYLFGYCFIWVFFIFHLFSLSWFKVNLCFIVFIFLTKTLFLFLLRFSLYGS